MLNSITDIYTPASSTDPSSGLSASTVASTTSEADKSVEQKRAIESVRTEPGQKSSEADGSPKDSLELSQEAEEIRQLQARDTEVRAHEAAHKAAGGSLAGAMSFGYERGPDGQSYATSGEVSISISAVPGDPEATLQKAEQVRTAALAPVQPSSQDLRVAARAQAMASEARMDIAEQSTVEIEGVASSNDSEAPIEDSSVQPEISSSSASVERGMAPLSVYA